MKIRDVLKMLADDGWKLRVMEGSHRQFVHPAKAGKVTVAGHPSAELDPKTKSSTFGRRGAGRIEMNKNYAIFIAPTGTGYSAHVPDLPGCVAAGKTRDKTLGPMREAIELHLRSMREDGDFILEPSHVGFLGVA